MENMLRFSLVLGLIGFCVAFVNNGRIIRSLHHTQVSHDNGRPQHFHTASGWPVQGGFSMLPPPHHSHYPTQPNYPEINHGGQTASSSFASSSQGGRNNFGSSSSFSGSSSSQSGRPGFGFGNQRPNYPSSSSSFASSSSQSGRPDFGYAQSESGSINFGPLHATFSKSTTNGK